MDNGVSLSVVIPTTGRRPSLHRAIRSVLDQVTTKRIEVLVVNDGFATLELDDTGSLGHCNVRVLETGGGRGGCFARNAGVDGADGRYVAFLDDDDEWMPEKVDIQLAIAEIVLAEECRPIISGRIILVDSTRARSSRPVPSALPDAQEDVADYLFVRRAPKTGRATIHTSTILCETTLAREVRWREGLARHQDWDWLLRANAVDGSRTHMVEEVVASVSVGSAGSLSAGDDWAASLDWVRSLDASLLSPASRADFLAGQTLRYALQSRSAAGVRQVGRELIAGRRLPSISSLLTGSLGAIPRPVIDRMMTRGGQFHES